MSVQHAANSSYSPRDAPALADMNDTISRFFILPAADMAGSEQFPPHAAANHAAERCVPQPQRSDPFLVDAFCATT